MKKRLIAIVSILFVLVLAFSLLAVPASAEERTVAASGTSGTDATWTLYSDGELVISGSGEMTKNWSSYSSSVTSVTIEGTITNIVDSAFSRFTKLEKVTISSTALQSVGISAFYECSALKSIVIPDTVKTISKQAFYKCSDLESVKMPASLETVGEKAFYNCTALEAISLPSGVTSIANYAFEGCSSLKTATLLGAGTIGNYAFRYCTALESIEIPLNTTSLGSSAFYECTALKSVDVKGAVSSISNSLFYGCTALETVSLPSGVTSIAANAFRGCTALKSITLPDSVTSVGNYAFEGCTSLQTAQMSASLQSVGTYAFSNCTSLASITLPEKTTSIGTYAFRGCSALKSVSILGKVASIGTYTFENCTALESVALPEELTAVNAYAFRNCSSLLSITLPAKTTTLATEAFSGCTSLKKVEMLGNITTINARTFYNCSALENVSLSAAVTSIGDYAFWGCSSLEKITLPSQLKTIGAYVFQNCTALTEIEIPNTVTAVGKYTFDGCSLLKKATLSTGMVSVADYLFSNCTSLETVLIGENCSLIGEYAFQNCTSLKGISLPDRISTIKTHAFDGCTSLKSISIPTAVKSISDYTFQNCSSLESVVMHDNITAIGTNAFYGCTKLDGVILPANLKTINTFAFYNCASLSGITIPEKVTSVGNAAFGRCTSLAEIKLAAGNTTFAVEDGVLFNSAKSLLYCYPAGKTGASYTFLESTTSINTYAFSGNVYLKTIAIPEKITQLQANVFEYCTALETLSISAKLFTFGNNALFSCTALKNIDVDASNASYCDVDGVLFSKDMTYLYVYPAGKTDKEYTVPSSVAAIGTGAFAFAKLENVDFGDAKCTLYSKAFYSCKALTEVELPLGVSKLINDVFEDCSNLAKVVVYNKSTNFTYSTGLDIFKNCSPDLVIHGLSGSKAQTYAKQNGYEFVEFATSGKLGENVEWSLTNGVLSISGIGAIPDFESVDDAPWRYVLVDAKSISVKGGITAIGNNVFSGCTGVTEVHLAESVAKIGDYAFNGCTALERLIVLNKTVEFGENVFASCPASITIYGRSNSAAQTYASDNSYDFVVAYDFGTLSTGIIWHLKEDGTLRFTSAKVEMPNFTLEAPAPWSMYGDFIKTADLDYLLSAGDYAFYNCTKLERIYTCGYFKTVGKYAFAGCTSLQGINWVSPTLPPPQSGQSPKAVMGDSAFEGCTSLKNVSLPSSLSTMGNAAFRGCTALEKIAVYGSVSIGNEAFANCTSLECAKILVSRTVFGTDVFKNVPADFVMYVYTGSTAETYAEDNGHDCVPFISYGRCGENLEWVLYADNELVISGTGAMYDKEESYYHTWYSYGYKDSILKITIESGATTIGDYAFFGCSQVKSISIPDTVTSIGDHAFDGCKALTSVDIHKDVTAIGTAAFKDCTALTSVNVAEDNENYSDVNGVLYCGTELVCYPAAKKGAEFAVPDSIVSIGGYAFYGCGTLESVTLPKTVQTVAAGNFAQCGALVKVVILNKEIAIDGVMSGNEALTIYGFAGSTAETYANANSIAFVAIADEITNVNVTVGTDLTLNYYAKIWDSESEKLVVTADNKEFEIEGVYDEAVGLYKFSLFGLPPQGMTTLISAKLVRGEEELDVLADFSIRQYLDMLLTTKPDGMSDEKYEGLKTLIADMLEYGAAAQEYTGYATDSMANADVDGASSFVAPQANITSSVKTEVTGAEIVAVGVRFDYANKIFYHIVTDDISKVTLEVSGLTLTADDFEKIGSNKYIAYSGDILATQLDDKVTAVLKVDGQTAQTVDYSVASYVYVMHGETSEGEPTAMATLCMRLYTYGRSAAAYAAMN